MGGLAREASAVNSVKEELVIEGLQGTKEDAQDEQDEHVEHTPDADDVTSLWWSHQLNPDVLSPRNSPTKKGLSYFSKASPEKSSPVVSPRWMQTKHGTYVKSGTAGAA